MPIERRKKNLKLRSLFPEIVVLAASLVVLYMYFTKQKIKTVSDLETVQSRLMSYSFKDSYRGWHSYYIFLEGQNNGYKIPADFLSCFDKSDFESAVHPGDVLTISFNKSLMIFSVSDGTRSYLSADSTMEKYNHSDLDAGLFMFVLGCVLLVGHLAYNKFKHLLE